VSSTIQKPVYAQVYTGTDPGDLSLQSYLYPVTVTARVAPGRSEAVLEFDYGRISRNGGALATVSPLEIGGHYVQIKVTNGSGTAQEIFFGILQTPRIRSTGTMTLAGGSEVPTGVTVYRATGIETLLDQVYFERAMTELYGQVDTPYGFNGTRAAREKNRSSAKVSGYYRFAWDSQAEYWTARDIVEYALAIATAETDFSWELAGESDALDYISPQVDPAGRNVRDILNACIRPQDAFTYRVTVSGWTATVTVISMVDEAIEVDAVEIVPANSDTLSLTSETETDRLVQSVDIEQVGEAAYSEIEVYSEPIRVTATLKLVDIGGSDGLAAMWSSAEETAFGSATDLERQDDTHRDVFARFGLPSDWDGNDFEGNNLIPTFDKSDGTVSFAVAGNFAPPAHVLERTFPVDETDLRPALLLLSADGEYINGAKTEKKHPPVGIDLPDTGPEIRLKPKSNVLLGKNHFAGSSAFSAYYDFDEALVTVSFYTDTRLAITQTGDGDGPKRAIYAPGYHLWVTPNLNTKTDRNSTQASNYQRDDRTELKRLAAMLASWYGRQRNTITYTRGALPTSGLRIGKIVTEAYSGGEYEPIATVVTSETYAWHGETGTYTLQTDFADLNLQAISRRRVESDTREVNRRIRRIEEALRETPLRTVQESSANDGPFFPVRSPQGAGSDDKVKIGPNRSANTPGLIMVDEVGKTVAAAEEVAIPTTAGYYVLFLEASLAEGGAITHAYVFKQTADLAALQAHANNTYFPLGWVQVIESDSDFVIAGILWPCVEWIVHTQHVKKWDSFDSGAVQNIINDEGDVAWLDGSDCDEE